MTNVFGLGAHGNMATMAGLAVFLNCCICASAAYAKVNSASGSSGSGSTRSMAVPGIAGAVTGSVVGTCLICIGARYFYNRRLELKQAEQDARLKAARSGRASQVAGPGRRDVIADSHKEGGDSSTGWPAALLCAGGLPLCPPPDAEQGEVILPRPPPRAAVRTSVAGAVSPRAGAKYARGGRGSID